ncbi:MAG: hypothetical protein LWX07_11965, partial [Bacteroidetes bacterium]|nr:hypothetical protein [Bacteroidota bacterium]
MKKILLLLLVLLSVSDMIAGPVIKFAHANNSEYVIQQQILFNPNRIMTWIQNTGIFNQDIRTNNTPGFSWPIGSNRFAIFTTGLTIGAKVNGAI